jgi:D-alanyl-D-alanine carboxypeptidase/D-alanyl-D-alanine-endopeptidase (penicillin-binding protein 4)
MMRFAGRWAAGVLVAVMCVPAGAKTHRKVHHRVKPLKVQIAKLLSDPAVSAAHWGILVTKMDGKPGEKPIYALNEGQLFQPASNAKLFTTAAAMALLGPETTYETKIVGKGVFNGAARLKGDLVLVGAGDANLSGRTIPYVAPALRPNPPPPTAAPLRYLEEMADQVAATGLKVVNGDVVGDDTLFPWEPYAENWTIDDAVWGYGAPVSALTINDNQIKVTVTPGDAVGKPATVVIDPAVPYYTLEISVTTGAVKSGGSVQMERMPGSKVLRIYGSIAQDAAPDVEEVAIEDPAEYAAVALKAMLEARGIVVTGKAWAEHAISSDTKGFMQESREAIPQLFIPEGGYGGGRGPAGCIDDCPKAGLVLKQLASHRSANLGDDVVVTNKVSQNLHAELLLHQLGATAVLNGSTAQGARVVRAFLEKVGIDKDDFVFYDGSGLSGHDLVAPRATVTLLQYATTQPWFADWKASLPVGGEDGSLAERFAKAPLAGRVIAKTGTLGEARALSGYLECASGRTVIFSIMVGNHMPGTHADRDAMDKIVAAIAETN